MLGKKTYNIVVGNKENKVNVKQNSKGQWLWDMDVVDDGIFDQISLADCAIYKCLLISEKYDDSAESEVDSDRVVRKPKVKGLE